MAESRSPQNDESNVYLYGEEKSLEEIIAAAREHFGEDVEFSNLSVTREHFHARCIGYDLYDRSDYDDYIVISRN